MRNGIRSFLELQYLHVHTLAFVGEDEVGVHGAVGAPSLLCGALPGQGVALQAGLQGDVGHGGSTRPLNNNIVWRVKLN